MKKVCYIVIAFIISLFMINDVNANTINKISMDIYVDSNGTAHVKEIWDANLTSGTEGYKGYGNLENAKISNFKVKEAGREYTNIGTWNTSASFENKAYKSGLNKTYNKVELCFGISKYGHHTYELSYDIEGFVATTSDADIIYWNLIPDELTSYTDNVYIKIHSDFKFADTLDVWGYGNYGGLAYVADGIIEMSNQNLSNGEYMTILVKFDKGTFKTTNVFDNDFNYYYNMAESGSEKYVYNDNSNELTIGDWISIIFQVIFIVVLFPLGLSKAVGSVKQGLKFKTGSYFIDFGTQGKRFPKDVNMFRDIPYKNDIYRAYWVAYNYNLIKKETDFLGVILLKWLLQKHINFEMVNVGRVFQKEEIAIIFKNSDPKLDTELEKELFKYFYEASGNGILASNEFNRWCERNYKEMLKWFDDVLDYETKILISEGKLVKKETKNPFAYKNVYQADPSMYDEALKLKGLKQFFIEFENMTDKEAIDVLLWEDYLMYAELFGVADKVAKQFKKLYPDVITDFDYNDINFVNSISYSGISAASAAMSKAISYSSGGGGFSSGGGGGGSIGSGGGGGFR